MWRLKDLPDSSRVWIFQSEVPLSFDRQDTVSRAVSSFVKEWSSHGHRLRAAMELIHGRFIVLAADEASVQASGCSIDKVFQFIQQLEQNIKVGLLDRKAVVYEHNGQWVHCSLSEFWARRKAGLVNEQTRLFDNTVTNLGEWRAYWVKPFGQSWHQQMWN